MSNMSKSSLDKAEDYIFLKQKNDKVVKELASMKGSYSKLQSDVDYLMREKFIVEQRANRAERVLSEIDTRSKICLNKMVEVSTELTRIFELIRSTKIRDNSIEIFGDMLITEEVNNELNTQNNSLKDKENLTQEEIDGEDENSNDLSFESRGGRRLPKNHHFPIAESDVEVGDENVENSLVDKSALTVIPEEDEDLSYNREEIDHCLTLLNSSSGNLFSQVPKNLRRREHAIIQDNDSSITVETNSSFENSDDNDNTLKDDQNNSTVTLRRQSKASRKSSPKPTPKRISFIKRKSIGSPVPQSLECRGSKRRKSDSPISTLKNKKSRKSYPDTRKSSEGLSESHTNEQISVILRTTTRSSLFQTKDLSEVQSRCLNDSDNSLGCELINNNDSILDKSKEVTGSFLEKTITQANSSNSMADWLKNTSTPLPTQTPHSTETTKFNNSKVCSRRKEQLKPSTSKDYYLDQPSTSKDHYLDQPSTSKDYYLDQPSTSKDYYLDETLVSEESEEEMNLKARRKKISKSTNRKPRSRITCRIDPDAGAALEENESFSSPSNRGPRRRDSIGIVVQRLTEIKRKKMVKKLEQEERSISNVSDTQQSSSKEQKSKNENDDSQNQQKSNRSSENEDLRDQSESPVSTKRNKTRYVITSSDDEDVQNENKSSDTQQSSSKKQKNKNEYDDSQNQQQSNRSSENEDFQDPSPVSIKRNKKRRARISSEDESVLNENKSNEKSRAQTGGSKVNDDCNSSIDEHQTHNNSDDFDSQATRRRRSIRIVSPGYNSRPENKRYWNIFKGLDPDAETAENESFSSSQNKKPRRSDSNEMVVQRLSDKKRKKTLKKLEQPEGSSSKVSDTKKSSSKEQKSKNEYDDSQNQQKSNRSSENEDFQDQSPVSTRRSKKRRAGTSSEDESVLNDNKRSTGRSKRIVKKVEYKEPSLHVKLRRN